ncbi:hypothetical protein JCGZ_01019 [Jatropha curcas]|uniref:Prolamin-like domain-containing protein n=1 Tax=Jatropha curcas TaxID=180498 RepID=A0A067KT21_JATCU|nr:hypothetical protein JCGZ_01019 [Jatropha curcas]
MAILMVSTMLLQVQAQENINPPVPGLPAPETPPAPLNCPTQCALKYMEKRNFFSRLICIQICKIGYKIEISESEYNCTVACAHSMLFSFNYAGNQAPIKGPTGTSGFCSSVRLG